MIENRKTVRFDDTLARDDEQLYKAKTTSP